MAAAHGNPRPRKMSLLNGCDSNDSETSNSLSLEPRLSSESMETQKLEDGFMSLLGLLGVVGLCSKLTIEKYGHEELCFWTFSATNFFMSAREVCECA